MKQVFLSGSGQIAVFDAPIPSGLRNGALIRNAFSVISTGTEGAAVTKRRGIAGIYEKATASRDRVTQVWQMAQREGALKTYNTVLSKLQEFSPIGYSAAGIILETGSELSNFAPGDRVACMGAGFANHAQFVTVPRNLMAHVPHNVPLEQAAFASIACIALQGIRRLELSPGESIGVIGLGLIGQIATRLAAAMGYEVFGTDIDPARVDLAGAVPGTIAWISNDANATAIVKQKRFARGLDGVVICAATESSDPANTAFDLLRPRGRVAVVGDVGLNIERERMYRKELELRLSCSYGPGRYDSEYELNGRDYPLAYARWTEGRNLEFFLHLLESGRLSLAPLISGVYPVEEACQAYARVKSKDSFAVILDHHAPETSDSHDQNSTLVRFSPAPSKSSRIGLGIIGVGSFARAMHLPNIKRLNSLFDIQGLASRSGSAAAAAARTYNAAVATSDYHTLLEDKTIDAVLITTRHASHARITLEALNAGKHVFVEKPMATTIEDSEAILAKAQETGLVLRVGFNRRFAPMLRTLRDRIGSGVRMMTVRANIGTLTHDWSNTAEEGGRFLGEATHFIDLCNWYMDAEPISLQACFTYPQDVQNPNGALLMGYADGSAAQLLYTTLGAPGMGKEYFELFGNGRSGRVDNYERISLYGTTGSGTSGKGDKGQFCAIKEFGLAIQGRPDQGADARAGLAATRIAIEARRLACGMTAKKVNAFTTDL